MHEFVSNYLCRLAYMFSRIIEVTLAKQRGNAEDNGVYENLAHL